MGSPCFFSDCVPLILIVVAVVVVVFFFRVQKFMLFRKNYENQDAEALTLAHSRSLLSMLLPQKT